MEFFLVFFALFSILSAQEPVYYADEVIVRASREEKEGVLLPSPIYSTSELDYLYDYYTNMAELAIVAPSLRVDVNPKKNESRANFRGLFSDNGTVLVNGVACSNPWDNSFIMSEMTIEAFSKLEFYPSGGQISTPSEGVGATINLIPRRAKTPLELESQIQTGSYGWKLIRLMGGGRFKRAGAFVTSSISSYDGKFKNTDFESYNISFNADYSLGRYGKLGTFSSFHSSKKGAWGNREGEFWRFPFWQTLFTSVEYENKIGSKLTLSSKAFLSRWDNLLVAYRDSSITVERYRSLHHNKDYGGEIIGNAILNPKTILSFGAVSKIREMHTTNEGDKAVARGQGFIKGFFVPFDQIGVFWGARANFSEDFKWRFDYETGITFFIYKGFQTKFHFSSLTGFPSLRQLYNENQDEIDHSNRNLRPSRSSNYELTLQYKKDETLSLILTAFDTKAKDLVGTVPVPPPVRFRFENISSARLTGVELSIKGTFKNHLKLFANYAYNDSRNLESNEPLEHSIYNSGGAGAIFSIWRLKPSFTLLFRSKERIRKSTGEIGYLPGYAIFDVGLDLVFWKKNSVFLLIQNTTDKDYYISENIQGNPRTIKVGLNLRY